MNEFDGAVPMGAVAEMAHEYFAHVGHVFTKPGRVVTKFGRGSIQPCPHHVEKVGKVVGSIGALAADIPGAWLWIEFDGGYARAVLAPVAHFLQQKLHFLNAVEGSAIFFMVKFEWLKKPKYSDAALVVDNVAHFGGKGKKGELGL